MDEAVADVVERLGAQMVPVDGRGAERFDLRIQKIDPTHFSVQNKPEYWDVTYDFRGQTHHMQTTYPPGATVTVNRLGEPRN